MIITTPQTTMIRLQDSDWLILRIAFFVIASVSFIGMMFNSLLFIATIRSSNLRSTCNILIACCAIFDFTHEIGSLVQYYLLENNKIMDSSKCSLFLLLPEMGISAGVFCVFCVGLDRMLSTHTLFSFRLRRKWLYLTFHLLLIASYCSYTVYLIVAYYEPQKVICGMPSSFHGIAVIKWNLALTFANALSVITYTITWFIVRRNGASTETRRIFRSICIVMAIDVAGWTLTTLFVNIIMTFNVREGTRFALHAVAGICANCGIAFKALVYYTTSIDYRNAFQQMWNISIEVYPLSRLFTQASSAVTNLRVNRI